MAGQTGAAAYQRLQAPDNIISQSLQNIGDDSAKLGAEFRAKNERDANAKAKEAKDYQERVTPKGDEFLNTFTGFADADDNYRQFAQKSIEKNAEYSRLALDAQKKGDMPLAREYEAKMSKLKNTFKNVVNGQSSYAKQFDKFRKDVDAGKVSELDEEDYLKLADNVNSNNYMLDFDDGDNPIYKTIVTDDQGRRTVRTITNGELINGGLSWRDKVNIVGKDGFVDNTLKQLGKRVLDTRTGNYINTNQVWDNAAEQAANARIDVILASNDSASDVLYQITGKKTPRGEAISEEDAKVVRERLMSAIKGGYDESRTTKLNLGEAELAERTRANKAREAAEAAKKDTKTEDYSARNFDIKQIMNGEEPVQFGGDFKWEGQNYNATKAYLSPDGKNVVIEASYTPKGSSKPKTKSIVVPKNERTLNNLFDAFSKKPLSFEKVIQTDPYAYRDTQNVAATTLEEQLAGFFNESGSFNDKNKDFVRAIQNLYPDADVKDTSKWWSTSNGITINGKRVLMDNGYDQAIKGVKEALGIGANKAAPSTAPSTAPSGDPLGLFDN